MDRIVILLNGLRKQYRPKTKLRTLFVHRLRRSHQITFPGQDFLPVARVGGTLQAPITSRPPRCSCRLRNNGWDGKHSCHRYSSTAPILDNQLTVRCSLVGKRLIASTINSRSDCVHCMTPQARARCGSRSLAKVRQHHLETDLFVIRTQHNYYSTTTGTIKFSPQYLARVPTTFDGHNRIRAVFRRVQDT